MPPSTLELYKYFAAMAKAIVRTPSRRRLEVAKIVIL